MTGDFTKKNREYMDKIRIYCENTETYRDVEFGTTLLDIAREMMPKETEGTEDKQILAALVDNSLKGLNFEICRPHRIQFIGYGHPNGIRTYARSLCFVLQKAVRDEFPGIFLNIKYALPSGLYCELHENPDGGKYEVHVPSGEEIRRLKARMKEIIAQDIPFRKAILTEEEAEKLFEKNGQPEKEELLRTLGRYTYSVYFLGETADSFYGPMLPSTGYLKTFELRPFGKGMCLQYPGLGQKDRITPMKKQSKLAAALDDHEKWSRVLGVSSVGSLNKAILDGHAREIINLAEARHERKYAAIADAIWQRHDSVKIVFIAGPSSSGKTSSSLRLAQQCRILGLNPKVIELDNYFVDREHTPKDENGNYDFESLHAMDLDFLNAQLNDLLAGKEIEIPKFNFKTGARTFEGNRMRLEKEDILIMEGIHALNPEMVPGVDQSRIFRVYASALTSLSLDENNNISTTDNRILRRMVRDNRVRGISPEETILRWPSVRRGENRNIFPFQENADVMFNSALVFELPMLKYYAEPLLRRISPTSPAYSEAVRLLKFLSYIVALSPEEIAMIPPTSIMREFIGGQTL